ncbi:MAG: hypothetical protein ACYSW6_09625 [Planctomycetota bacterium]|jgi:hypothetical protein
MSYEYYEERAEITREQWEYLERRVLERREKEREAYRKFMTAVPEPNHDYRNAVIVSILSTLFLVGVLAGALLILMHRVN